jgi:hypothetical protein
MEEQKKAHPIEKMAGPKKKKPSGVRNRQGNFLRQIEGKCSFKEMYRQVILWKEDVWHSGWIILHEGNLKKIASGILGNIRRQAALEEYCKKLVLVTQGSRID